MDKYTDRSNYWSLQMVADVKWLLTSRWLLTSNGCWRQMVTDVKWLLSLNGCWRQMVADVKWILASNGCWRQMDIDVKWIAMSSSNWRQINGAKLMTPNRDCRHMDIGVRWVILIDIGVLMEICICISMPSFFFWDHTFSNNRKTFLFYIFVQICANNFAWGYFWFGPDQSSAESKWNF